MWILDYGEFPVHIANNKQAYQLSVREKVGKARRTVTRFEHREYRFEHLLPSPPSASPLTRFKDSLPKQNRLNPPSLRSVPASPTTTNLTKLSRNPTPSANTVHSSPT